MVITICCDSDITIPLIKCFKCIVLFYIPPSEEVVTCQRQARFSKCRLYGRGPVRLISCRFSSFFIFRNGFYRYILSHGSAPPTHEEGEDEQGSAGEACRGCCGFSEPVLLPPCQRVGGCGVLHFAVVYLKNLFHDLCCFSIVNSQSYRVQRRKPGRGVLSGDGRG